MTTATLTPGLKGYHPEMNEPKPAADIEARLAHYGRHWFLWSRVELKGRGIDFLEVGTAETLVPGSTKVGWFRYKVTDLAFKKICQRYAVSTEMLL